MEKVIFVYLLFLVGSWQNKKLKLPIHAKFFCSITDQKVTNQNDQEVPFFIYHIVKEETSCCFTSSKMLNQLLNQF